MKRLLRPVRDILFFILAPLAILTSLVALALSDLAWLVTGRRRNPANFKPAAAAATVVIPTWNGKRLLERNLPPLVTALGGNPRNEILVVDNGSSDGTAEFLRHNFPQVTLLALKDNLGFGGGSNAGFRAARNQIVVLLNNDMRVEPDFLQPLLDGFVDDSVFSVTSQIYFTDASRLREETGLTQGWWEQGLIRVRHRIDPAVDRLAPVFYGGGGSTAYDRAKFLELGGFDHLLAPFYYEDADLGFLAWRRGWKVLFQPASIVHHEHRGTIGRTFSREYIDAVLNKNVLLVTWKNIHSWRLLLPSFFLLLVSLLVSPVTRNAPGKVNLLGFWRAFLSLPALIRSRWQAKALACVDEREAFARSQPGYYRDRFLPSGENRERLSIVFVCPYPVFPPVHGGGVFMFQTLRQLSRLADVHLVGMLDNPDQLPLQEPLRALCASAEFHVRNPRPRRPVNPLIPHAIWEFADPDFAWLVQRQIFLKQADLLQLDYTPMAQYGGRFHRIPCALFQHDVYFQSVARRLFDPLASGSRLKTAFEYLRALRYEIRVLPAMDGVQVCSADNAAVLESWVPELRSKLRTGLRAAVDTSSYDSSAKEREPYTMLFVGGYRHAPNREAVTWFLNAVLPLIILAAPASRFVLVGSGMEDFPASRHTPREVEVLGSVEDTREPLARYAVFVCPIRSGSGVRVKLLEAFAAGIPVVSTSLGAEGLAKTSGEVCLLADQPREFAAAVLSLFRDSAAAAEMARRARALVEQDWDSRTATARLMNSYRELCLAKRLQTRQQN